MILHASCIDIDGRGILILGESGSGKSTLAIQLIALGASLVADDKTLMTRVENHVVPGHHQRPDRSARNWLFKTKAGARNTASIDN